MPFKKGEIPEGATPFKKGESGNPSGREKGSKNRSTIAKYWLEVYQDSKNPITGGNENLSQEDLMTLALIKKAIGGDVNAYKALMDSGYGSLTQSIEQNNTHTMNDFNIKDLLKFDKP